MPSICPVESFPSDTLRCMKEILAYLRWHPPPSLSLSLKLLVCTDTKFALCILLIALCSSGP